jgi:hypothetical protein
VPDDDRDLPQFGLVAHGRRARNAESGADVAVCAVSAAAYRLGPLLARAVPPGALRGSLRLGVPRGRLGFVIQAAQGWGRAVEFLLQSDEPAIRFLARRDLLDEDGGEDTPTILSGPRVSALLSQRPEEFRPGRGWRSLPGAEFGFGVGAYRNWTGAHWRLVSLAELGDSAAGAAGVPGSRAVARLAGHTGATA